MSDIEGPTVIIGADASGVESVISKVTQQFEQMQTQIAGMGGKFEALGQTMSKAGTYATVGITAPMTAALGAIGLMTNQAAAFQGQMTEVFTLLPGISSETMGKMSSDVQALAGEYGIMAEDMVPALYQAISAGIPSDNVMSFLETASKAAIAGVTDVETSVDGLSSVMNGYTNEMVTAERAGDVMFTTVRLGKTTFGELSDSMYQVVPSANQLGVSIEDIGAAFAALSAQGTPTAVAGTQLKAMLKELSDPASKLSDYLAEISGGETFKQQIADGETLYSIFNKINESRAKEGLEWAEITNSQEASAAAIAMATDKMADFTKQEREATGAVDAAFKTTRESVAQQMKEIQSQTHNMVLDIGKAFLPIVKDDILPILKNDLVPYLKETVIPAIQDFAKWFSSLDEGGKKAVAGIGAFAFALGPLMMVLGPIVSAGGSLLSGLTTISNLASGLKVAETAAVPLVSSVERLAGIQAIKVEQYIAAIGPAAAGATGEVGILESALVALGGPVGIVAIAAVTAGLAAYATNFGDFRDNVNDIIKDLGSAASDISTGDFENAGRDCAQAFADGLETAGDLTAAVITNIPNALSGLSQFVGGVEQTGKEFGEGIGRGAVEGVNSMTGPLSNAIHLLFTPSGEKEVDAMVKSWFSGFTLEPEGKAAGESFIAGFLIAPFGSLTAPIVGVITGAVEEAIGDEIETIAKLKGMTLEEANEELAKHGWGGEKLAEVGNKKVEENLLLQKYDAWQASYNPVAPVKKSADLDLDKNWVYYTSKGQSVGDPAYFGDKKNVSDAVAAGTQKGMTASAPSIAEAYAKDHDMYYKDKLDTAAALRLLDKNPSLGDKYRQQIEEATKGLTEGKSEKTSQQIHDEALAKAILNVSDTFTSPLGKFERVEGTDTFTQVSLASEMAKEQKAENDRVLKAQEEENKKNSDYLGIKFDANTGMQYALVTAIQQYGSINQAENKNFSIGEDIWKISVEDGNIVAKGVSASARLIEQQNANHTKLLTDTTKLRDQLQQLEEKKAITPLEDRDTASYRNLTNQITSLKNEISANERKLSLNTNEVDTNTRTLKGSSQALSSQETTQKKQSIHMRKRGLR